MNVTDRRYFFNRMITTAPQPLLDALRSRLQNSEQPVLGSSLGTAIFTQWPEMDKAKFRATFGSLKQFLKQQFGEEVQEIGRKGGDTLFGWLGKSYDVLQSIHNTEDRSLWRLFTNPMGTGRLVEMDGHLHNSPDVSLMHPSKWKEIGRITVSEQIQIASKFVEDHVTKAELMLFDKVFEPPSQYWGKFMAIMRDNSHLNQRWRVYRSERIEELFRKKCSEAEISPTVVGDLWRELRDGIAARTIESAVGPSIGAHEITAKAIMLLTDDELSSVKLPTRVWVELLKRQGYATTGSSGNP